MTTLYKPRKPGLMDLQIQAAKSARHISNDGYRVLDKLVTGKGFSAAALMAMDVIAPNAQFGGIPKPHSYTEHGDFTHCAGRGL